MDKRSGIDIPATAPSRFDPEGLKFSDVTAINVARCLRWHGAAGVDDWSPERWMVATMGELGEAANVLKKMFRVMDGIANINDADRNVATIGAATAKLGEECADTFLYLNLFCARTGINLASEIIKKFNATSERYGFPERL